MEKKLESISIKLESKVRLDLSKKNPYDIMHFVSVLNKLEKEGKIRIKVVE